MLKSYLWFILFFDGGVVMEEKKYDLVSIKKSCLRYSLDFVQLGLYGAAEWLSELLVALRHVEIPNPRLKFHIHGVKKNEYEIFNLAFSYFRDKQYKRCASYLKNTTSKSCRFLRYYSLYLNLEMKYTTDMTADSLFHDPIEDTNYNTGMTNLSKMLKRDYMNNSLDGYQLYVYGLVLKRLHLIEDAKAIILESLHKLPTNWSAWLELLTLISEKEVIQSISLPNHWIRDFFMPKLFLEFSFNEESLALIELLLGSGFHHFNYLLIQKALCLCGTRHLEDSYNMFREVRENDPLRMESMDMYSRLLICGDKEWPLHIAALRKSELPNLATTAIEFDKYQIESSVIIGNYYAHKKECVKAIQYFKRAVRMNPYYGFAWELMAQEYLKLNNSSAAVLAFRKAISCKHTDYISWFGLSHASEIHQMIPLALEYAKKVNALKPFESRVLMTMGDYYEKLKMYEYAVKCYAAVRSTDNPDPLYLLQLARMYIRLERVEEAVEVYLHLLDNNSSFHSSKYKIHYVNACVYVSRYYIACGNMERAKHYADLLLESPENRDDYEKLMKDIKIDVNNLTIETSMMSLSGSMSES